MFMFFVYSNVFVPINSSSSHRYSLSDDKKLLMELTINSRLLVLTLIVCCLIYVISVEANDTGSGSGSGNGSGDDSSDSKIVSTTESSSITTSLVTSNMDTVLTTSSSYNMPMTLSTLSISTSQYFSSSIVTTFTPTEDTKDTDFILLRTPYVYMGPPVLLVIILMCCCLCGMRLCLYIKNRRKRRTYIFASKVYC